MTQIRESPGLQHNGKPTRKRYHDGCHDAQTVELRLPSVDYFCIKKLCIIMYSAYCTPSNPWVCRVHALADWPATRWRIVNPMLCNRAQSALICSDAQASCGSKDSKRALMAAFCSSHNFCIDCCFPGGLAEETGLLAFAGGFVPLLDLVRFNGSA